MDKWPEDKGAPIVVYCGSGHRSTIAMTILWSYGHTDVRSMRCGFAAWEDAGYPVAESRLRKQSRNLKTKVPFAR